MKKEFDKWNSLKKNVENYSGVYANTGEIWWCNIGINIGSESCGKNHLFERPVLILKVLNTRLFLIAPLTTKNKKILNHIQIPFTDKQSFLMIEQIKTISSKRLTRKIDRLNKKTLIELKQKILDYLLN